MGHILLIKSTPTPFRNVQNCSKKCTSTPTIYIFLNTEMVGISCEEIWKVPFQIVYQALQPSSGVGFGIALILSAIPNDFLRLVGASSLLGEGSHLYVIYYLVWAGYSTLSEYLRNKLADASKLQTGEDLCYWVDLGYSWLSCSYSGYLNFSLDFFSLLFGAFGLRDFSLYVIWL